MPAEAFQHGIPHKGNDTLARIFSQVFHPMTLSIISFLVVGFFALPQQVGIGLAWAFLGIVLQVTPGVVFFTVRLRQGAYSDKDVSVRHQRNELYFFSLATIIINLCILLVLQAPIDFIALLSAALIVSSIAWAINLVWKISVHASSAASCATVALLYQPVVGILLWIAALLVGWARVRTRNHTPLQVAAGYVLAGVVVWTTFLVFGISI